MSNKPKKIIELPQITSVAASDLFLVEQMANSTVSTTSKMTFAALKTSLIKGPYANDSIANSAGLHIGDLYYDSSGSVKLRLI